MNAHPTHYVSSKSALESLCGARFVYCSATRRDVNCSRCLAALKKRKDP